MSHKDFTPGPWTAGASAVYHTVKAADDVLVCFASMSENSFANARLLAAAPDMRDALTATVASLRGYRREMSSAQPCDAEKRAAELLEKLETTA